MARYSGLRGRSGLTDEYLTAIMRLLSKYLEPDELKAVRVKARAIAGGLISRPSEKVALVIDELLDRLDPQLPSSTIKLMRYEAMRLVAGNVVKEQVVHAAYIADVEKLDAECNIEEIACDGVWSVYKAVDAWGARYYFTDGMHVSKLALVMDCVASFPLDAFGELFLDEKAATAEAAILEKFEAGQLLEAFKSELPDEAFAHVDRASRQFAHHGIDVKDGAEKETVDLHAVRAALTELSDSKFVDTDGAAKKHLEKHLADLSSKPHVKAKFGIITKGKTEKRVVTGIVLEPEKVMALAADGYVDVIGEEEIEKCAWEFLAHIRMVKTHHLFEQPAIEIVESYIAPISFKIGKEKILKGSWIVSVRVNDDKLWEAVKSGEFDGFSIGGITDRIVEFYADEVA